MHHLEQEERSVGRSSTNISDTVTFNIEEENVSTESYFKKHIGHKKYQCDLCQENFCMKSNLSNHINNDHNAKKKKNHIAKIHSNSTKQSKCDICNQNCYSQSNLNKHMGKTKHTCDLCQCNFCIKAKLLIHLEIHHRYNPIRPGV